ncbi:AraC family transcriptional regulator ligand-binding domain-containing protein [Pseudomonas sp. NY15435]|uniref:helix-turn-helix transcriptional regulator n=1 Tax=Pseudomonas sp. NY15435 TaxID=3400358 RepID=UPI003A8582C8
MYAYLEKHQRFQTEVQDCDQTDFHLSQFRELGYLLASAATVGGSLESLARYLSRCEAEIHCRLDYQASHIRLHFDVASTSSDAGSIVEKWMLRVAGLIGALLGHPFHPLQVVFRHGPNGDHSDYYKRFGCPALFRQKNDSLILSPTTLSTPCLDSDPILHSIMLFYLDSHLKSPGLIDTQVAEQIYRLLPVFRATLVDVAAALRVNPRTLQRRLAEVQTDFEGILDRIRREQAVQLLRQTNMEIEGIANALGYRRTASFCRAHQRWFGISPVDARKQYLV